MTTRDELQAQADAIQKQIDALKAQYEAIHDQIKFMDCESGTMMHLLKSGRVIERIWERDIGTWFTVDGHAIRSNDPLSKDLEECEGCPQFEEVIVEYEIWRERSRYALKSNRTELA